MKLIPGIIFAGFCLQAFAGNVSPPFYAQPIAAFAAETVNLKTFTRLRLVLSATEANASADVKLGTVTVCSVTACYLPATPSFIRLADTSKGTGVVLADMQMPYETIQSIYFETVVGKKSISGHIDLTTPLKLEPDYGGAEIMVILENHSANDSTSYTPSAVATNLLRENGTSVYYNPKVPTIAALPMGVSITIPAGATATPEIFNVAVHDAGGVYPLLDIYPSIKLTHPATVNVKRIIKLQSATDPTAPPASPRPEGISPNGQTQAPRELTSPSSSSFKINETGVVRSEKQLLNNFSSASTFATVNSSGWSSCSQEIADPSTAPAITNALISTGNANISWCETITPFVHIGISNLLDAREVFSIPHMAVSGANAQLPLQTITYWMANTQMMIDGFNFDGDSGTSAGQYGYADGYVESAGLSLGSNRVGGGSAPFIQSQSAGNKLAMQIQGANVVTWGESANLGVFQTYNTVSSSTSIVKNGVCATDSLRNQWSAVGTTPTGRMVFISSTSGGTTTAAELCPVFQALGVTNALRLDGGPSTAMTLGGSLLNPITGLASFKYGSVRHIAYALKISWPGW